MTHQVFYVFFVMCAIGLGALLIGLLVAALFQDTPHGEDRW